MRILFLGDIVGQPGRLIVETWMPRLVERFQPDLTIANAENIANGRGITLRLAEALFDAKIDILTMGNHVWDNKDVFNFIADERRIVRPANYPIHAPGMGYTIVKTGNVDVAVINLLGRTFMGDFDSPFTVLDKILEELSDATDHIFIDFHAETTSEKLALAWHVAGRVSAVIGTHTHVQTADARILPGGTAYITDVGMCGPYDGIIGIKRDLVIQKFLTQMPVKFEIEAGPAQLHAVVVDLETNGRAKTITRVSVTPERVEFCEY
ncbi:metallophosphoesterase [Collibacillus ludicampi]|uniref:Metallophosphoesterase n=1 Tax=Collibacillus ludicampi TaxID=2771369 RepID=A0AAV4LJD2_9BACL|nr:TIGR00282 family metallophosphoesterase [Collibacillus ludicampi]GIM47883.1 metallophosphoesterase [Collibacillus ludicampi]